MKVLLWDIDGTLLNFGMAEKYAIRKCFSIFGIGECSDEMLGRYSAINRTYWERLERRELTREQVLHGRFEEFFAKEKIPFDKIREFNAEYQVRLGDKAFFHDDGYEVVKRLKGCVKQYAVTNGTSVAQERKLRLSGLDELLDGVFISESIGADKPSPVFFDAVWKTIGTYRPEDVAIIGDSLTSDMQGGNNAGILCWWYNPEHRKNDKGVRIDREIFDLHEVWELITNKVKGGTEE